MIVAMAQVVPEFKGQLLRKSQFSVIEIRTHLSHNPMSCRGLDIGRSFSLTDPSSTLEPGSSVSWYTLPEKGMDILSILLSAPPPGPEEDGTTLEAEAIIRL